MRAEGVRSRAEIGKQRRVQTRGKLISAAAQVVAQLGDRKATIERTVTERVRAIAQTGVDVISSGALTHSAPVLDIGLDA